MIIVTKKHVSFKSYASVLGTFVATLIDFLIQIYLFEVSDLVADILSYVLCRVNHCT
jgi:hypothetical protein